MDEIISNLLISNTNRTQSSVAKLTLAASSKDMNLKDWFYMLDMYHRFTTEHSMVYKLSSILVLAKCASCKNVAMGTIVHGVY
jgi:hypothetical protein